MMRYVVNQSGIETQIKRECSYLSVFDKNGKMYNIRVNKQGGLEISTIEEDLKVVCKTSNSLTVGTDE